jgi:hypothetical protein
VLSGTFATMPFPELLQWLSDSRRSGALSVTLEFEERFLQLHEGNITSVESDDPRAHDLQEILRGRGLLDDAELERSAQLAASSGQGLSEVAALIKPTVRERIQEAQREQAVQAVLGLFLWRDGRFNFSDGVGAAEALLLGAPRRQGRLQRPIETREMLMEGMRRLDEWQRICAVLPSDYCQVHALGAADDLPLTKELMKRGEPVALGGLWNRPGQADRFAVYEQLFQAWQRGLLAVDAQVHTPLVPDGQSPIDALVHNAQVLVDEQQWDEAAALLRSALDLDPFRPDARELLRRARDEQLAELYQLLPPFKVPSLTVARERLDRLPLSPRERHIAERINGRWDIGALSVVTPVGELETMRALKKLIHLGAVRLSD